MYIGDSCQLSVVSGQWSESENWPLKTKKDVFFSFLPEFRDRGRRRD